MGKTNKGDNLNNDLLWLGISKIDGITSTQISRLLEIVKDENEILKLTKEKMKIAKLTEKQCNELLQINMEELAAYNEKLKEKKIYFITRKNSRYPRNLKNIYDAPYFLYVRGNLSNLNEDSISIVGSRNCSKYGEIMAKKLSFDLAKYNKIIISGMARGIDTYAHKGSIAANGKTIAVLGSGIDVIYPKENERLYYDILSNDGTIVSEYPIGERPSPMHFPARNRIISGLCNKLIVVEAGEKSGTFITVDFALEQGKEIYAVPGNANSYKSKRYK